MIFLLLLLLLLLQLLLLLLLLLLLWLWLHRGATGGPTSQSALFIIDQPDD